MALPWMCGAVLAPPDWPGVCRLLLWSPLLEEWLVRAGVQQYLRQRLASRAGVELVLPALAFSALHLARGGNTALMVLVPGLLLGWVYRRRGSWLLCAVLHAAANGAAMLICRIVQ